MLRSVRLLSCVVLIAFASGAAAAGSAFAESPGAPASHGLGAKRPDARLEPNVAALAVLPASVDLRQWAVTPGNQGQVGSCVTWAIDYAMLGWYSRYSGRVGQPFAPMYTYSQIHIGGDGGSYPTRALRVALAQGSDTRAHYTRGDYDWRTLPTPAERANAAHYKIKSYKTLFMGSNQAGSITAIKNALATKHPVAIEMAVRHGFDYLGPNENALDDDVTSTIRGYHEVLAVGYDRAGLIIQNSWGTSWAGDGFGRISWRVVQKDVWEADTIGGFAQAPTPPTVSVPTASVLTQATPTGTSATYKVSWKGTVGTSGAITRYDVWSRVDGGAPVALKLATPTSTSVSLTASIGHKYRISVRPTATKIVGAVRYSTAFTPMRS